MRFEVFIPAADESGFDVTLRLEADNWMAALRTGLTKVGEQGTAMQNVICDIQEDNSIQVTDPKSQRVFRIRPMEETAVAAHPASAHATKPEKAAEPAPTPAKSDVSRARVQVIPAVRDVPRKAEPVAKPAPESRRKERAAKTAEPPRAAQPPPAAKAPVPAAKAPPPAAPPAVARAPSVARPPEVESAEKTIPGMSPPGMTAPAAEKAVEAAQILSEHRSAPSQSSSTLFHRRSKEEASINDILAQAFEDMMDIEMQAEAAQAADLALSVGLKYIDADGGSVLLSDINGRDLVFTAVRGPKSERLRDVRIRMGQGIVGFCAQHGVSLAVSDAQKDPRFFAQISKQIGVETRSILCVPIERDGRSFGAMEIINKRKNTAFSANEMNILNYIASRLSEFLESRA